MSVHGVALSLPVGACVVCVCTSRASRCMQYVCIIVCVCKCACVCLCTWRCACGHAASSLVCSARWRWMVRPLSQINSAILVVSRAHKQAVYQQVGVRSLSAACSALYSSSCECRLRSALAQQSVTLWVQVEVCTVQQSLWEPSSAPFSNCSVCRLVFGTSTQSRLLASGTHKRTGCAMFCPRAGAACTNSTGLFEEDTASSVWLVAVRGGRKTLRL